jgi:hypothetical protein
MKTSGTGIGRLARKGLVVSVAAGLALAAVSPAMVLTGCEEKKKKVEAPPPPPPPPPPKAPDPIQVDPVLQSMKPDARVQFPQSAAPFLGGSGAGRSSAWPMTSRRATRPVCASGWRRRIRRRWDALVGAGDWDASVKKIEGVRGRGRPPTAGRTPRRRRSVSRSRSRGQAYVVGFAASKSGSGWVIGGANSPTETKPRASDFDGVSIGGFVPVSHSPIDAPSEESSGQPTGSSDAGGQPARRTSPAEEQSVRPKPRRKMTPQRTGDHSRRRVSRSDRSTWILTEGKSREH